LINKNIFRLISFPGDYPTSLIDKINLKIFCIFISLYFLFFLTIQEASNAVAPEQGIERISELLDLHIFKSSANWLGKFVLDLGNAYLSTQCTISNQSAIFGLILFPGDHPTLTNQYRPTVENLQKTEQLLKAALERCSGKWEMKREDKDLVWDELQFTCDLMIFACQFGIVYAQNVWEKGKENVSTLSSFSLLSLGHSSWFQMSSFRLSSFLLSSFRLSSFRLSSFGLSSFHLSSFRLSSFPVFLSPSFACLPFARLSSFRSPVVLSPVPFACRPFACRPFASPLVLSPLLSPLLSLSSLPFTSPFSSSHIVLPLFHSVMKSMYQ
jgi:hypothetical protein